MTLSVHGNIYITKQEIQEKKWKKGVFFEFRAVSKHPSKDTRTPHKVTIFVPNEKLERARQVIKPGQMLGIRHAELDGYEHESGTIYSQVRANWNHLEVLRVVPSKERQ